jgi:hypothetical protein
MLGASYLRLSRSDWFVHGSSRGRPTLYRVLDELATHDRVLTHIDEADKFQIDFGAHEWSASVAGDLWNLMDRIFPVAEYLRDTTFPEREAPTETDINSWIRTRLWIVGSGTWQRVFTENQAGSKVGFLGSMEGSAVTADTIAHSELISPELLHRFSSDLLFLHYPSREETARLLESTGINALAGELGETINPDAIPWKNGGLRVLETIATRLVIARIERDRTTNASSHTALTRGGKAERAAEGPSPA